jgi:hypothetical protein
MPAKLRGREMSSALGGLQQLLYASAPLWTTRARQLTNFSPKRLRLVVARCAPA